MVPPDPRAEAPAAPGQRGVSEVVGVVLLFGMVLMVAALIVLSGSSSMRTVQEHNEFVAAEMSMQEFRAEVGTLAYGNESAVKFEVAAENTERVSVVRDGHMVFQINDRAACTANRSLGTVVYEDPDGDVVAYQANGVWKRTGGSSIMLSAPNLEYRTQEVRGVRVRTLDFPLTNVNVSRSEFDGSDTVVARKAGNDAREEIQRSLCLRGDGADEIEMVDNVTIRIEGSTFYRAWGRFLQDEFGTAGAVSTFDHNRTVVVRDVPLGLVNDRDDDGVADGEDNCPDVANAGQWDQDDDGVGDACDDDADGDGVDGTTDNCPDVHNPDQDDADGDGVGDACDSDPGNDDDRDGVEDARDNCPDTANADQRDSDGDGVGDACDEDDGGDGEDDGGVDAGGPEDDRDGDGVPDDADNCPETPNHYGQDEDADGDGVGDACEDDDDGDGVKDGRDNCPSVPNPNQGDVCTDSDGDGIPDAEDECPDAAGAGENGCESLSIDEEANALVVNQTGGTVTMLGTQAARTVESEESTGRAPLDVMFVLDKTGSMRIDGTLSPSRYLVDDPAHWYLSEDLLRWEEWESVSGPHDGVRPGNQSVPDDEIWAVKECTRTYCTLSYYGPGDDVSLHPDQELAVAENRITVPEDEVWVVADPDDDGDGETVEWRMPGEVVRPWTYEWFKRGDAGSDPTGKRVNATRSFVESLSAERGDRAGFVEFNDSATVAHELSNDLGSVQRSLHAEASGSTDISRGLDIGVFELENSGGPEEDVLVLLTDGKNTRDLDGDGRVTGDEMEKLNERTRMAAERADGDGVTVFTVALGDDADTDLLRSIAHRTGGRMYSVDSAGQLPAVFEEIAEAATDERNRRLQHDYLEATVRVGSGDSRRLGSGNLGAPDRSRRARSTLSFDVGARISLSSTSYDCRDPETVDVVTDPIDGERYEETTCTATGSRRHHVDNDTSAHAIYTDGDRVPGDLTEVPWYGRDLASVVRNYDSGMIDDGRFDLGPNQAIVVTKLDSNQYAAVLFEADDDPPDDPGGGGGRAPGPDDRDSDGRPDDVDNCPGTPNYDQRDSNGDGTGDACSDAGSSPDDDADDDGVPDDADNCPDVPNNGQVDADGDGVGNACDDESGDDGGDPPTGGESPGGDHAPGDDSPSPDNGYVINVGGDEVVVDDE